MKFGVYTIYTYNGCFWDYSKAAAKARSESYLHPSASNPLLPTRPRQHVPPLRFPKRIIKHPLRTDHTPPTPLRLLRRYQKLARVSRADIRRRNTVLRAPAHVAALHVRARVIWVLREMDGGAVGDGGGGVAGAGAGGGDGGRERAGPGDGDWCWCGGQGVGGCGFVFDCYFGGGSGAGDLVGDGGCGGGAGKEVGAGAGEDIG